jgi:hypothetical protein
VSNTSQALEGAKSVLDIAALNADRAAAEEQRRKQAEWSSIVLRTVRSEFHARGFELPASAEPGSSVAAGEADAALTASRKSLDAGVEGDASASVKDLSTAASSRRANGPERMTFEVDGGLLGTVKVTVGREQGAIKVVIGIDDARQRALVGLEQDQLIAALRAAGLKVASVSVQAPEAPGTAFAQSRRVMTPLTPNPAAAYRGPKRSEDVEADSGLNLVG